MIIEYKRSLNENVINQGLFYLDWLMDHKAEFTLLTIGKLGKEVSQTIDWTAPRLLCIANDFSKYDEHAVQQINRNIELIRYRRFGENLLLLELVNATTAYTPSTTEYKTISETLSDLQGALKDLYEELKSFLLALGDDVQEKILKYYVAFKRIKNFACVEIHPGKGSLTVFVKVNPETIDIQKGFTCDVREIGHYGTGELEMTLRSRHDFEKAKNYLIKGYKSS